MKILITGRPGIGKTTLIKELVWELKGKAGGFYTEEMRKGRERVGFRIETLDGKRGILAKVDIQSPYKLGKYKIDLEDFERVVLSSIERALKDSKVVIIDEIGPMELFSGKFKDIILRAFDSPNRVIATIKEKGSKFIDKLKSRKDVTIYTLNRENRKKVVEEIMRNLTG